MNNINSNLEIVESKVEHFYASNDGVNIHCAAIGQGPLMILLHGFPDHWLGWWEVMNSFAESHRVIAIDLRGYNLSDKPVALDDYKIEHLVQDVRVVVNQAGYEKAIIVGHDWGGFIAWHVAMDAPEIVDQLVILNMPHPWAISRELVNNPDQQKASEYVRRFKHPLAHTQLTTPMLSFWVKDDDLRLRHVEAMEKSSKNGMLNYYVANWPQEPYQLRIDEPQKVKARTLILHGLKDIYALPEGLNDVWSYVANQLAIEVFPDNGHFLHHENPKGVIASIRRWLVSP
jgi:pimeloyl-ACP methyl ester carboxylesterase